MKKCFIIFGFLILVSFTNAQISVTIPTETINTQGVSVSVPVNVTNFNGIGSISFKITYDPAVLSYQGIPDPIAGNFISNASAGVITIGWFGLQPLNAGTGALLHLNFNHIQGSSNLNFLTNFSSVSDTGANTLPVSYTNGAVNYVPVVLNGSIGDKVWNDLNSNGLQDIGEPGVQWVTVKLFRSNNTGVAWTMTDSLGNYSFADVAPGSYYLKFYLVDANANFIFTGSNVGSNDEIDSDVLDGADTTDVFTLAAGETSNKWDAGVVPRPINTGKIGNYVWIDTNQNGIQDNGEAGAPNVTVKLFDGGHTLVSSTVTNPLGAYSFDNLVPGDYSLEFVLPGGSFFSPKDQGSDDELDSDADETTGKTSTISVALNQISMKWDAGIYSPSYPSIALTKDDHNIFMPAIGGSITYDITYKNTGNGSLLNGVITDTLPAGLTYVSCTGANSCGSANGIVSFDLGTVNAGGQGLVTVTASVSDSFDSYLNMAWFSGKDQFNNNYMTFGSDLNLADTCSGGGGGGVESRGDMAELLLKRQLMIQYGQTTPILSKIGGGNSITSLFTLQQLVPQTGPFTSYAVETTPFDILGISNAISAYAVDYNVPFQQSSRRVATIFSTITAAPQIYDHTKAVCDRLAGYSVKEIRLIEINGQQFYASVMKNEELNYSDYAVSFSVYETSGAFHIQNKWTYSEYTAPQGAQYVYNFQVWSGDYSSTIELVKEVINRFTSAGTVTYMNGAQFNPNLYITSSSYSHLGKIHLTLLNNSSAPKNITLSNLYRGAQGSEQMEVISNHTVPVGISEIVINSGIISDAEVTISQAGGFKDQIFASGGAYAYFTGTNSTVTGFQTSNYPQQNSSNYPDGSLILSGGVVVTGQLNDWVSVIRGLNASGSAYSLNGYNSVRFEANGTGKLMLIVEQTNTQNFNYFAASVTMTGENKEYVVNFSDLHELYGNQTTFDPSKVKRIGFIYGKPENPSITSFTFEVKNIAFLDGVTGVSEIEVPTEFGLSQNYPNPFNPATIIEFAVATKEMLDLSVYDILGQKVITLLSGELDAGYHKINFNATGFASGVYFYKLTGKSVNMIKKMILTK